MLPEYNGDTTAAHEAALAGAQQAVAAFSRRGGQQVPPFPNLGSGTATFGPWFSLDGVHPSTAAHRLIADLMMEAVHARYGTTIPTP